MNITSSPKYLKDCKIFAQAIENINNSERKVYYKKLFDKFQFKAKMIDEVHSSFNPGKIQPNIIREHVKELSEIRHELDKLSKS